MLQTNREHQAALDRLLKLRYPAVAFKLIEDESQIPANAVSPMDAWGQHIALCQAFAYARRHRMTLCLRKEDHWCWTPLMCYGLCDGSRDSVAFQTKIRTIGCADKEKAAAFIATLPHLPRDKYPAMLMAPLDEADFEPDLTLIYSTNGQLRLTLMAVFSQTGTMLDSSFMPLESCIFSVIPPIVEGKYRITLPDPGEYERAFTGDDQIIFSVPAQKEAEFYAGIAHELAMGKSVDTFYPAMERDFPRPSFYNKVFEDWGLGVSEVWDKEKK